MKTMHGNCENEEMKKKIIFVIQEKAEELGRAPKQNEIGYTYKEIQKSFGSMKQALVEANVQEIIEKEKQNILKKVKVLSEELGRIPTQKEIGITHYRIKAYFGSSKEMIALSDVDTTIMKGKNRRTRTKTKEEVLQMVHEEIKELGRVPVYRKLKCRNLVDKHFGSWNEMLEEAGLPKKQRNIRLEKEEILKNIHKKAKELGRTPKINEVEGAKSLIRNLGKGWKELLREEELSSSEEELLNAVRKIGEKLGRTPTCREVPIANVMTYRYGTWNKVLEAAGFEKREKFKGEGAGKKKINKLQ